ELEAQLASDRPPFEALIAELDGTPVGFALFFQSYSTWEGKAGLYLEDLYVSPEHRGNKIGTALFRQLSQIAIDRGYARIDWQVLDWNEPSIKYYQSIGAEIRKDWYPCRLEGDGIMGLSKS
ncbi:MAG: GNAT family N-acetyltransferase, partial [Lentilitoribacter sp.]